MVLIKCFTDSHIENMAACLHLQPEKMILLGSTEAMHAHVKRYQSILHQRKQNTQITVCDVKTQNLIHICQAIKDILCPNLDCMIDLTGGDEPMVMAVGAVVAGLNTEQRARIQVVRYDFSQGCLLDCIHNHTPLCEQGTSVTVDELVILHGGMVHPESYQPPEDIHCAGLDPLWNVVASAPKEWNRAIAILGEFESRADSKTHVCLPLRFLQNSISNFQEKEEIVRDLLEKFHNCGVIDNRSSRNMLEYTYNSPLFRYCTQKAGNVLEMKVLLEARELYDNGTPYFRDCQMGVNIDWDGVIHDPMMRIPETRNEIDLILTRGMTSLFISCKNGSIGEEELYKLHTVASCFGGVHARKMLIATDLDQKSAASNRAFIQRAWDMDIFLVTDAAELTKAEWKQIFLNAMA